MFKGVLYNSVLVYRFVTWVKLFRNRAKRFLLVASHVESGNRVLDLCSGPGDLKKFLAEGIEYRTVECSKQFIQHLQKQGIKNYAINLRSDPDTLSSIDYKPEICVMIISLYSFRDSSVSELLEVVKHLASKKVVIVEEVLSASERQDKKPSNKYLSFIQKIGNRITPYLCDVEYTDHALLYDESEFKLLMEKHGFRLDYCDNNYIVAVYDYI